MFGTKYRLLASIAKKIRSYSFSTKYSLLASKLRRYRSQSLVPSIDFWHLQIKEDVLVPIDF